MKNNIEITTSNSYTIELGKWATVRQLRKALESVGHDVKTKDCLIKQAYSSLPAYARDNYVIQRGDEIEFTNKEPMWGERKQKTESSTVKVCGNTYNIETRVSFHTL